jgi:hypothetical protein
MLRLDDWNVAEDRLLLAKHREFGGRWIRMAEFFPNRTDTMLKNRFQMLMRTEARKQRPPKVRVVRQLRQAMLIEKINPAELVETTSVFEEAMFIGNPNDPEQWSSLIWVPDECDL